MTLRLPEERVRALYERWQRGEVTQQDAAADLGVDRMTVVRRWARYDERFRQVVHQRKLRQALGGVDKRDGC